MAVQGESVEDRMASKHEHPDRWAGEQAAKHENPDKWASEMAHKGKIEGFGDDMADKSGSFEMAHYNEPEHKRFNGKDSYANKHGKGSLESVENDKDMYLGGNETNRP